MEKIKLSNLMHLERLLLEIDEKYKFELDFSDAYKLCGFLKSIGDVTSYAFSIQDEYFHRVNDIEKLRKYHDKVMDSQVEFDAREIVDFIEYVNLKFNNSSEDMKLLLNG